MSSRVFRAINTASWAHAGQLRKGTDIPYASHVYGVMHLVAQQPGAEEDTVIAALLHDVLEDAPERYSAEAMEKDFGRNVVDIVRMLTKDRSLGSWQERAHAYLMQLEHAPLAVVMIAACDKVHNLSSIVADYRAVGEKLWERFNSGKKAQLWWYQEVYAVVQRRLDELNDGQKIAAKLPIMQNYHELLVELDSLSGDTRDEH